MIGIVRHVNVRGRFVLMSSRCQILVVPSCHFSKAERQRIDLCAMVENVDAGLCVGALLLPDILRVAMENHVCGAMYKDKARHICRESVEKLLSVVSQRQQEIADKHTRKASTSEKQPARQAATGVSALLYVKQ